MLTTFPPLLDAALLTEPECDSMETLYNRLIDGGMSENPDKMCVALLRARKPLGIYLDQVLDFALKQLHAVQEGELESDDYTVDHADLGKLDISIERYFLGMFSDIKSPRGIIVDFTPHQPTFNHGWMQISANGVYVKAYLYEYMWVEIEVKPDSDGSPVLTQLSAIMELSEDESPEIVDLI